MRTIETTIYKYDELSELAKETARAWFREGALVDYDHIYEDAETIGALIGIRINRRDYDTIGGERRSEPCIYFSGFSSQGDGACFDGEYAYAKNSVTAVREHAPQNTKLHRIAAQLAETQKRHFYKLRATCKQHGMYSNSASMNVDVELLDDPSGAIGDAHDLITRALRDFADWIYEQLRSDYEYQTADEQVADSIIANEYEFTEDGKRAV